ncbi:hypothetical protein J437_LFUL006015, partial [Ladona fulva]
MVERTHQIEHNIPCDIDSCTLTSGGEVLHEPDFQPITKSGVEDTLTAGTLIIEYVTDGVKDIKKGDEETFITAQFADSKLTFSVLRNFQEFEQNA